MILLLEMCETLDLRYQERVDLTFAIFRELDDKGIHKLAHFAVERISKETIRLRNVVQGQRQQTEPSAATVTLFPGRTEVATSESPGFGDYGLFQMTFDNPDRFGPLSDTVMSNTGMYLLEDPGLQAQAPPPFSVRRDSRMPRDDKQASVPQRRGTSTGPLQVPPRIPTQQMSHSQPASPFAVHLQPGMYHQQMLRSNAPIKHSPDSEEHMQEFWDFHQPVLRSRYPSTHSWPETSMG